MYLPEHFTEADDAEILGLISDYPFATLVANTAEGLSADHLPMLAGDDGRLFGHIAMSNSLHRDLSDGSEVLAIFQGQDAFISPNWYPSKAEHHKQVPTWNYQVVHVHGPIRFQHDEKTKRAVVGRMTKYFETHTNGDQAWRMADAPRDYIQAMLDNIVAFEIKAQKTFAKSKLSQNKDDRDLESVAVELGAHGKTGLMRRMRKILSDRLV